MRFTPFATRQMFSAIDRDDHEEVSRLLTEGYKLGLQDALGRTALAYTIEKKRLQIFYTILEHDPDLTKEFYHGSYLHITARYDQVEMGQAILSRHPELLNKQNRSDKEPALHVAAQKGHIAYAMFLSTQEGIDFNLLNKNARSAYFLAERAGHKHVTALLLPETNKRSAAEIAAMVNAAPVWKFISTGVVARISYPQDLGLCLTEVFDRKTEEYLKITHDLATMVEFVESKPFADMSDKALLKEAFTKAAENAPKISKRPYQVWAVKDKAGVMERRTCLQVIGYQLTEDFDFVHSFLIRRVKNIATNIEAQMGLDFAKVADKDGLLEAYQRFKRLQKNKADVASPAAPRHLSFLIKNPA